MKPYIFTLFLFFLVAKCIAGKDDDIKSVVNKWNEVHNTHNTVDFLNLYAPTVLFYGKVTDINSCYNLKTKFLNSDFQQKIITPITLTYYSSGIIKCDFTKQTRTSKRVREHFCYLLVKKINGRYLITGESDLVTDQNKNITLNLGEEKFLSKQVNFKYWTIIGVFLIIALIVYYLKRQKENKAAHELPTDTYSSISPTPQVIASNNTFESTEDIVTKVKTAVVAELKDFIISKQTVKEKGEDFEKYVVEQFDENKYKILEWRSDKFHNGKYAISNTLPDLEYKFKNGYQEFKFAIECKWRKEIKNDELEWARIDQLKRYKDYERAQRIPVFILIGLGGKASDPDHLFVIPLEKIYSTKLNKYLLQKYERKTRGTFDFDPMEKMLY